MRTTVGKEKEASQRDLNGPAFDATLREYCDKHYNQLLPILAEKMHQEKVQQEKLKVVKTRLNFEEVSQYSESGTPSRRKDLRKRLGSKCVRRVSGSPEPRCDRSKSPRRRDPERRTVFKRLEKGVFHMLGDKEKGMSAYLGDSRTEALSEGEDSAGGHWKSKSKKKKSSIEDEDLSQPWVCEETNPFTPRICYFDLPKRTRMPSHVKTYDGSEDPEDHLKIFQAAAKVERWAMPTWCHMFNSTLIRSARVWFDDLPPEFVDNYNDQKEAFLENYLQQKNIQSRDVKGAPEVMRISGFIHGITNHELIKRLHDNNPKSVDEMMRITTSFLKGEKDIFTLLSKTPKEILALEKGKFKTPPPMMTPTLPGNKKSNGSGHCPLIGFSGEIIWPLGQILLLVKIRDKEYSTSAWMNFVTVRSSSPYNGIIGRPGVRKIQAILSTAHGMLKFPVAGGILTLKSSKIILIECVVVLGLKGQPSAINQAIEERIKKPVDMTGIPRYIAEHRLDVREGCPPVRQKKRGQAVDMNHAIQEEVEKLVDADFKDLNKACPKDGYPLPKIDWKVESLCGFPFKCFLDAYKGATYQRLVDKAFHKQIGRNLKVYVDDLVIKSRTESEIIKDIKETFKTLREINMKLNPKKCTFGVEEGMFLGYKVNTKGIKVCSDKADVVLSLPSPKCLKDVQKLNGKLASLNRFLAKSAEKSLPLPMLTAPEEKEELIVYLASAKEAPRLKRSRSELHIDGKISHGIGTCQQASEKIVSSTPNHIERPEEDSTDTPMEIEEELPKPWILFTDGSSYADGSGVGPILTNPEGTKLTYVLRFRFEATNNEAKYEALITGLRIPEQMGVKHLKANVDSRLVANQINEVEVLAVIEEEGDTWMTPIYEYLTEKTLPAEVNKARAVRRKSQRFTVINVVLYEKSFLGPWLRANRSLGEGIKARLDARSKDWMEEISHVLWVHHTMIKSSNRDTLFSLTYGTEVVIPAEIGMPTLRIMKVDVVRNNEALEISLDLLEERREQAAIREAKSKAKMEKYYNLKVRSTSFKPGDLVYHRNDASYAKEGGKLGLK
ncbi:reverse transcriptase domain-containing protein [Tanacetum coccineum]